MSEIHIYILLTADFKAANEGKVNGANILKTATTKDGRIVTSANALNEFPELFIDRSRVTLVALSVEDFELPSFQSRINN